MIACELNASPQAYSWWRGSATLYKLYSEVLGAFRGVTETIEVMNIWESCMRTAM